MNELSIIFNKLGIDTKSVLKAAGTKFPKLYGFRGTLYRSRSLPNYKAEELGSFPNNSCQKDK